MTAHEEVIKTFTAWARYYDATHSWTLPYRRQARLALGVQPGDRVLDLACGTGVNFSHLRALVGEQGEVTGVDITPALLAIAHKRIDQYGWRNVEAREADAAQLPFPDASFDKAICTFALNIIPDYTRAIVKVERVLKPGRRFVALEMRSSRHSLPSWLHFLSRICAVDLNHQTLEELEKAFFTLRVQKRMLGSFFTSVATKRSSD